MAVIVDVLRSTCDCVARFIASATDKFVWSHKYQAWHFTDMPMRRTTWKSLQPTGGEPYLYTECPFCGHTLPGVTFPRDQ